MIENEELKRKLAKWAGFEFRAESGFGKCWIDPIEHRHWKLPDFTESLDACFKWLVPKLLGAGMDVDLANTSKGWAFIIIGSEGEIGREAETPALALCLAIEKLIAAGTKLEKSEGGKKNEQ